MTPAVGLTMRSGLWRVFLAAFAVCSTVVLGTAPSPTVASAAIGNWTVTADLRISHVQAVAVAPGGRWGAAVATDPNRLIWVRLASGSVAASVPLPAVPTHVAFDVSGGQVAVSYGACAPGPGPCAGTAYVTVIATGRSNSTRVVTGSGAGLMAGIPGGAGQDILVADAGAGTVADVNAVTGAVTRTVSVSPGVLSGLAVSPDGELAAVSSETAGEVWVINLRAGRVQAEDYVPGAPGPPAFDGPTVYVGQQDGEHLFGVDTDAGTTTTDSMRQMASELGQIADGLGDIVYLPSSLSSPSGVLLVGSLTAQEVDVRGSQGWVPVPFGLPSSGVTGTIVSADGDREALAIAPRGLLVLSAPTFAASQRLRPNALGGAPTALACADGGVALLDTRSQLDVLRLSAIGTAS